MSKFKDKDIIETLEEFFKVPGHVADKVKVVAEKVRGGYVLIETRPPWNGSNDSWTKSTIAKIIYHKPTNSWKLYWMRGNGKWVLYKKFKSLNKVIKTIKEDEHGCFWG